MIHTHADELLAGIGRVLEFDSVGASSLQSRTPHPVDTNTRLHGRLPAVLGVQHDYDMDADLVHRCHTPPHGGIVRMYPCLVSWCVWRYLR